MPCKVEMEPLRSEDYKNSDYLGLRNISLNISEHDDTKNIGISELSHPIEGIVSESSPNKYENFENECNFKNNLAEKFFIPNINIFNDSDQRTTEEDIDNEINIVNELNTELATKDKQINVKDEVHDTENDHGNEIKSPNLTTLNINVVEDNDEGDYFNLSMNIKTDSDSSDLRRNLIHANISTDEKEANRSPDNESESYFQFNIIDELEKTVKGADSKKELCDADKSCNIPNIVGHSKSENRIGKFAGKKKVRKNITSKGSQKSDSEINNLGESLAKLNVDPDQVLVSGLTDTFQQWNITSDVGNSSDEDEDDVSDEEQDAAFEGDDENDDNDEDVDDFEQRLRLLLPTIELISKSPVPRPHYTQKFCPYTRKQDSMDPSFDFNSIQFTDEEKKFLFSIPVNLQSYTETADKSLPEMGLCDSSYNKQSDVFLEDIDQDEGNGSPSGSSEYNIINSPMTEDDYSYMTMSKTSVKSCSVTSDLGPSPARCDSPQSISSPDCSASDTENPCDMNRRRAYVTDDFHYYPSGITLIPDKSVFVYSSVGNSVDRNNERGVGHVCPTTVNDTSKNNIVMSNKVKNDKPSEKLAGGNNHFSICVAPNNNASRNSFYVSSKNETNEGSMVGNTHFNFHQVPVNDTSKNLCYVSNKENVTEFTKPSLQNGGRVFENKLLSNNRELYILPNKPVNIPSGQVSPQPIGLPKTNGLLPEQKVVYRQPAIQPHGGLQLYESEMNKPAIPRLLQLCKSNERRVIEWIRVLVNKPGQKPNEETNLIQILKEKPCPEVWPERMIAHISYIKRVLRNENIFITLDKKGNSPLRLAAFEHNQEPLMARCIADCIVEMGRNPDHDIDSNGESVLHQLAYRGDSHVKVLAELLNVTIDGQPAFNVNRENIAKMTPLHVAIAKINNTSSNFGNDIVAAGSLATVKLLIKHGAKLDVKDDKGCTPLHYALRDNYDLGILRELLQSPLSRQAINIHDNEGNTPLHVAAANNCLSFQKQKEAMKLLVNSGARTRRTSYTQRSPLSLVSLDRKEEIKKILQKKS